MTTTTDGGPWYVLQDPPDDGWPEPGADPGGNAVWLPGSGTSPTLVSTDSLSGPAHVLTAETVAALDDALPDATLTLGGGGRDVATVLVDGLTADAALTLLEQAVATRPELSDAVAALDRVPLYFVGAPQDGLLSTTQKVLASAKSPFAGVAREAVVLPGSDLRGPVRQAQGPPRRPVVAIVDSGVGRHPWLTGSADDAVVRAATDDGWSPLVGRQLPAPDDVALTRFAGHGTFVAGVIHQEAPEAQILSLHVMDGHGVSQPENVVGALEWVLERVRRADPAEFVDVVCLAFGYYEAHPGDHEHTSRLRQVLGELGQAGVQVVVAAGNESTQAPTFPAAFTHLSADSGTWPAVPLVSVGALNPDRSPAEYSNHGPWVLHREVGTAVLSTVPVAFDQVVDRTEPVPFDPDHTSGGLVRWGGTSFAAATLAGRFAAALTGEPDIATVTTGAVLARAATVRAALLDQPEP